MSQELRTNYIRFELSLKIWCIHLVRTRTFKVSRDWGRPPDAASPGRGPLISMYSGRYLTMTVDGYRPLKEPKHHSSSCSNNMIHNNKLSLLAYSIARSV